MTWISPCKCNAPSWCEIHQRDMTPVRWSECKNRPAFFEAFQNDLARANGKPNYIAYVSEEQRALLWCCTHRGEKVRQEKGNLCGYKGLLFTVFQCAIHEECALTLFCKKQKYQACNRCDDREEIPA